MAKILVVVALAAHSFSALHGENLGDLDKRLEVIGTIKSDPAMDDYVGFVLFKDLKKQKTLVIQVGKAFSVDQTIFRVSAVKGKSVIVSDGVQSVTLNYGEGRLDRPSDSEESAPVNPTLKSEEDVQENFQARGKKQNSMGYLPRQNQPPSPERTENEALSDDFLRSEDESGPSFLREPQVNPVINPVEPRSTED